VKHPLKILSALAAAALLQFSGGAAMAEEAVATTSLNVRSGPGTGFSVVDTLAAGEVVDMTECQPSGWCYITHAGPSGWVSSTYLTAGPGAGAPAPECRFELEIGPGGPRFRLICDGGGSGDGGGGSGDGGGGGDPAPVAGQACFYDGPNYTGAAFCRGPGVINALPGDANDPITSVLLSGDIEVRLCRDTNLGGFCRVVRNSERELGGMLNDRVSSLQVFAGEAPAPGPSGNRACFYDLPNFAGESFCRGVVTLNTLPSDADDRITSVQISGAVRVRLCQNPFLTPPCNTFSSSVNRLGAMLNNRVSSLRVFIP